MVAKKKKIIKKANITSKIGEKETPIKKMVSLETPIEPVEEIDEIFPTENTMQYTPLPKTTPQPRIKRGYLIPIIVIFVIIFLLYTFRSQFIVATINGQLLSRTQFNAEMEKEAGKKSMDALVTKILIVQEANKKEITVSDAEVNDQLKMIKNQLKKQGQNLDQALTMQGLTMLDLKEQIKIEKLIEKLLGKKIQVTDKEVTEYMQKMQEEQQKAGQGETAPKFTKDMVKQQLKQTKMSQEVQPWLKNLQDKAKIIKFVNL